MDRSVQRILQHPELEGGPFYLEAGKTGVLLLHGLTATTAEVRPFAQYLYERGITVAGPLLPGHGTTPQELNRAKWKDWVESAEDAYQGLCLHCDKIMVAGESMGGMLALYLASRQPEILGVLLYSPAFSIRYIEWAQFLKYFMAYQAKRNTDDSMPWQGYYVNPVAAAAQLHALQREVRKRLPRITQPVLIMQGRLDQTINPQSSQMIYDLIGSREKKMIWLEESGHVVLLDREFERVAQISYEFIETLARD